MCSSSRAVVDVAVVVIAVGIVSYRFGIIVLLWIKLLKDSLNVNIHMFGLWGGKSRNMFKILFWATFKIWWQGPKVCVDLSWPLVLAKILSWCKLCDGEGGEQSGFGFRPLLVNQDDRENDKQNQLYLYFLFKWMWDGSFVCLFGFQSFITTPYPELQSKSNIEPFHVPSPLSCFFV